MRVNRREMGRIGGMMLMNTVLGSPYRGASATEGMLKASTTLSSLKTHPYLKAFALHMMPRPSDIVRDLPLSDVAQLMPWHGFIHTEDILRALNRLVTDKASGKEVFFRFYEDTALARETGLFFFRGKPGAPFSLISPGGGFVYVGSLHEGFPLAERLSTQGIKAFVIQYRVGSAWLACEDLAHALSWIIQNAKTLDVDPEGYSLWGGSAGARMAAYLGSYGTEAFGALATPRAAAVIMQYTGHTDYTREDPPTYAIVSRDDPIAKAHVMKARLERMAALGIPTQFHLSQHAGHGFGLGTGSDVQGWEAEALEFWLRQRKVD